MCHNFRSVNFIKSFNFLTLTCRIYSLWCERHIRSKIIFSWSLLALWLLYLIYPELLYQPPLSKYSVARTHEIRDFEHSLRDHAWQNFRVCDKSWSPYNSVILEDSQKIRKIILVTFWSKKLNKFLPKKVFINKY